MEAAARTIRRQSNQYLNPGAYLTPHHDRVRAETLACPPETPRTNATLTHHVYSGDTASDTVHRPIGLQAVHSTCCSPPMARLAYRRYSRALLSPMTKCSRKLKSASSAATKLS